MDMEELEPRKKQDFEIGQDLSKLSVDELKAQKQRLNIYTVQARFALAAIYDLSATTVGSTNE